MRLRTLLSATALLAGACAAPYDDGRRELLPVMEVSEAPSLEIGVLEGDERYTFVYGYTVPPGWAPGGVVCGPTPDGEG